MEVSKLIKEIEEYKKFKKDIVNLIMLWDEEDLPENNMIIETLKTIMHEFSRLEDIEDKKVQVAVDFIEEKRDKYWKDKIKAKIKELENTQKSLTTSEGMIELSSSIDILNEILEET